jgi:hypothetical protein
MDNRVSILFYGKKCRKTKDGLLPIYMRVTIDGARFEVCTQRFIDAAKWSATAGKVKSNSEEARSINTYLDLLKAKVYQYQRQITQEELLLNIKTFRAKWLGVREKPRMVMEIFQEHNNQVAALVGHDFAAGTLERYKTSLQHTRSFIQWKFNLPDIDVKKLNYEFISD